MNNSIKLKKLIHTTIKECLNEKYINTDNIKHWMNFVFYEIQFIQPTKRTDSKKKNYNQMKVFFSKTDKETNNELKQKLTELKDVLLENGIMISFFVNYSDVEIYFKRINVKVEPTRYVYHSTSVDNRDSILKYGLIPKSSDESKEWVYSNTLSYPKAIFATMINLSTGIINPWKNDDSFDIWRIDTEKLNNDWFVDLNYVDEKNNNHIMTFQPILPKYLEIAKKGINK
jgi:hypothetical protein